MHMIAPVRPGTDNVVSVMNSIQTMPASAAGSAVMITNGSDQDWQFTTIRKYSSTTAPSRPNSRPVKALFMVCTWPSSTTEDPFGTSLAVSAITWRMLAATAPRSRPEVVAKICTIDWMSYCDTTALEVERLTSAIPPRIGDCA